MSAPRLHVDLEAIAANSRELVDRLSPRGIGVTGVTKALLGAPEVAREMLRGGVTGLGDSRVENLARLRAAGVTARRTLIRSASLSGGDRAVREADVSFTTEQAIVEELAAAAARAGVLHAVVLMVELGDLREGIAADDVVEAARAVQRLPGLRLIGLGANLACQSGVAPDQSKMDELSRLADAVDSLGGPPLSIVSGGNSANLGWALATADPGRVTDLRLGESILLGTDPLDRRPIPGLRTDAVSLTAEVIEAKVKPAQPWGRIAQGAFGVAAPRTETGAIRQLLVALGRQDTDPAGLTPPTGIRMLGASSDHLVLDAGDHEVGVGEELRFGLDYSALVRAATSPYVDTEFGSRTGA